MMARTVSLPTILEVLSSMANQLSIDGEVCCEFNVMHYDYIFLFDLSYRYLWVKDVLIVDGHKFFANERQQFEDLIKVIRDLEFQFKVYFGGYLCW